ncbi:MAG TPA: hypothetical protein VNU94_05570 [Acidobacteriaceae bacterium]|nr:hypothetical protein [Acidobacteriaceae bacterium]
MRTPRFLRYLLLFAALLAVPACSFAGVFVSVNIAPPILPVYEQPVAPGDGYIWTPGYWAWDPDGGYYWVPGAWVFAPYTGALWTPGYWGWSNGFYVWNGGYWGLHIGFYGGVNYGFGYYGHGYEGGYWDHGHFDYNRSINHIDNHVHNTYERNVDHGPDNRVAFNGGNGGTHDQPTQQERVAEHEQHISAVPLQQQHQQAARTNRAQFANVNHGQPAVAATQRPGAQAFHQALAHPDNPQAVQAARSAPANHPQTPQTQSHPQTQAAPHNFGGGQSQEQAHPQQQAQPRPQPQEQPHPQEQAAPHNFGGGQPQEQAHPQQQAQPRPQPQEQPHPQEQARPAAPAPQSHPAPQGGGGGGAPHGGGGPGGGGGSDHDHH